MNRFYHFLGNAVSPPIVCGILASILEALKGDAAASKGSSRDVFYDTETNDIVGEGDKIPTTKLRSWQHAAELVAKSRRV